MIDPVQHLGMMADLKAQLAETMATRSIVTQYADTVPALAELADAYGFNTCVQMPSIEWFYHEQELHITVLSAGQGEEEREAKCINLLQEALREAFESIGVYVDHYRQINHNHYVTDKCVTCGRE